MTDVFVKTKEEAKQKRRELTNEKQKAHYLKLLWDRGYIIYVKRRCVYSKSCLRYPICPEGYGDYTEDYSCVAFTEEEYKEKVFEKCQDEAIKTQV